MKADEYDALIDDPSYFFLTSFMPRIMGALDAFKMISPITNMTEMYGGFTGAALIPYGLPPVQEALKALMDAGTEAFKWIGTVATYGAQMAAAGFPGFFGGGCKAPFDTIGDTLRGTRGIMLDMYRQPDKLIRAMEQITPIMIKMGVSNARQNSCPIVFIPLHKGDDTFMSNAQFEKFYWPSLKKYILALINEGIMVFLFAEGKYNNRLEVVKDLPEGWIIWHFDQTDMAKVKQVLGNTQCLAGNVPTSLMCTGTPGAVKEYCRKLIELCGKDGGYILTGGAGAAEVKEENLRAMMAAAKEYGVN